MRAAVYRGPNNLRIETVPVPRITPHELLVKVAVCGVCPTDIKKIQYGTVPPPRIFGHETAGTIVRVGKRVQGFQIGERVALHHHVPCLDCHACRHRAFAQCETYKRTGITAGFEPAGGGFAEYVRVMPFVLPGVVKIPARNSFEEGAMLEPVNTVLKAVKRLALLSGDNVVVAGQGPIGLMFTRILQLQGMNVLATDLMPQRLQLARKWGAKWVSDPNTLDSAAFQTAASRAKKVRGASSKTHEISRRLSSILHPRSTVFDAAVLAVPSDTALKQALAMVRGAGQVLLFAHTKRATNKFTAQISAGVSFSHSMDEGARRPGEGSNSPHQNLFALDLASICVDEKDLIGSYSADFTLQKEVARLVFSRKLDVRSLISHRFDLENTAAAVNLAAHPTPESFKVVVTSEGRKTRISQTFTN